MNCTRVPMPDGSLAILSGGGADHEIEIDGKRYRFEHSDMWGPMLIGKRGEFLSKQPGDRHPFWGPFHWWLEQGKRVENGLCVWRKPKEPVRIHLFGRQWLEVPEGEDPAAYRAQNIDAVRAQFLADVAEKRRRTCERNQWRVAAGLPPAKRERP